ncbi:MAG TPA: cytochrome c biogenesis protein ResB [Vitreimonas sp.]|nr:cytochrome c biogenesis protein ResB [Vitreimonas sp.]
MLQIVVLSLLAVIGMTLRQLPDFAFRSAGDYAAAMDEMHARYDPVFGPRGVEILESLQAFQIFSSTWFSMGLIVLVISIVVCTVDRTPRLWRQSSEVRVVQPDPFFDPRLTDRATLAAPPVDQLWAVLRRHRFRVREAEVDAVRYVYGDRNQYTRMATLLTHLGLILFLVAAAITARLGDEQGLALADGEAQPVHAIGTPGLLYVKNHGFEAPRHADGSFADFMTDLAVYRDGQLLERKVIRVNDPLSVAGYTFHQNGFRPAPDLLIKDPAGQVLWAGPVGLFEPGVADLPRGVMSVPGTGIGLELALDRFEGEPGLIAVPYRFAGTDTAGEDEVEFGRPFFIGIGGVASAPDLDFTIELRGVAGATILIAKHDPGANVVWLAFGSLIAGLAITFYLPRRRIWARLTPDGQLSIVGRSDRYVDFDREFGRLLGDLVDARRSG